MTDHTDFKIPRGVAMMLKNIIGIDPDEIMRQFHAALLAFKQFMEHFDRKQTEIAHEIRALRHEVSSLRDELLNRETSNGVAHDLDGGRGSESDEAGTGGFGPLVSVVEFGRSDEKSSGTA